MLLLVKIDTAHLLVNIGNWKEFYIVTEETDVRAFVKVAAQVLEGIAEKLNRCMGRKHLPPPRMVVPGKSNAMRPDPITVPFRPSEKRSRLRLSPKDEKGVVETEEEMILEDVEDEPIVFIQPTPPNELSDVNVEALNIVHRIGPDFTGSKLSRHFESVDCCPAKPLAHENCPVKCSSYFPPGGMHVYIQHVSVARYLCGQISTGRGTLLRCLSVTERSVSTVCRTRFIRSNCWWCPT